MLAKILGTKSWNDASSRGSNSRVHLDAINDENMKNYFDLLEEVYGELDFSDHPERIYNMDETGMPLDPRPPKIIAPKGLKKVRYQCSGQTSQITVIGCGTATGQAIPPFIIFAAKQLSPLWMKDEVPGNRYAVSDNGWIDQELFHFWLTALSDTCCGLSHIAVAFGWT